MAFGSQCAIVVVTIIALVLSHGGGGGLGRSGVVDARRNQGNSQRKPSSSSSSSHVTPSYSSNNGNSNGGNPHADVAKLSYPNYNSQPIRPAGNNAPAAGAPAAGWNVPQGPPPAYSASNPVGGARPNQHEAPPAYHAPNYGAAHAAGSNVYRPITATQNHGPQYAGVPPAGVPAGASYYPAGSYVPGGYQPAGGYQPGAYGQQAGGYQPGAYGHQPGGYQPGAYQAGGYQAGSYQPAGGYHPAAAAPPGATYYQAGSALPPGATYYAQPPQQSSSGLGFGTGLLAGGLGGALIGHALTPSGNSGGGGAAMQPAGAAPAGGQDRIIIIKNGVPVNATDGTTVINANGAAVAPAVNATQTDAAIAPPAQMAPFAPMSNMTDPASPPPGDIICVPAKLNETDPADSTKMIEVEKIACYPAPAQPAAPPGAEPVPLGPMSATPNNQPAPAMLPPDQAAVRSNTNGANGQSYAQSTLTLYAALLASLLLHFVVVN